MTQQQSDKLEEQLSLIQAEVAALQIGAQRDSGSKVWIKAAPILISLLALMFALVTTIFAEFRTQHQDTLENRRDLRVILQRLSSIPKEAELLRIKYPKYERNLIGTFETEQALLVNQAVSVADLIFDKLSASEYQSIGDVLAP